MEPVEADAEPGLGGVSVGLAPGRASPEHVDGCAAGPSEGKCDECHQQGELARVGEAGDRGTAPGVA